jgi:hypothetical protein
MGTSQVRGVRARRTHIETYELVGMFDGPSDRFASAFRFMTAQLVSVCVNVRPFDAPQLLIGSLRQEAGYE